MNNDRIYLNEDWYFCGRWNETMESQPAKKSVRIRIPHTTTEIPYNYFDEKMIQVICGYQRLIEAPPEWRGRAILLTFEAVGHRADVFVNGRRLITHCNGYSAFTVDIADALMYGSKNLISVCCDTRETLDQPPFGGAIDYLPFGGIYRDVYIEVKDPVYMRNVFYRPSPETTPNTKGISLERLKAMEIKGRIQTKIDLSAQAGRCADAGRLFVCQFLNGTQISNQPLSRKGETFTLTGKVRLWDVASPERYELTTELRLDGQTVDTHTAMIGFRHIDWRRNGFFLNGRRLKLRGLNRHQSYPYVGYAMPESMQRYDAGILKNELGLNAVRTSHYTQSQYFIDECDALGLLVFTEIPGWQHIGGEGWQDIAVENVREMIEQYRNHPSIVLWGVRINESKDNDPLYRRTNELAEKLDPTRPTGGVRCDRQMSMLEDVYTYNDFSHRGDNPGLEPKSEVTPKPGRPYLISEYNGHMFPTKAYDDEAHRTSHMIRHANVLDAVYARNEITGGFGWCAFDYNTHGDFGSGDRICYHGVMDMFRNPKLAAALYESQPNRNDVLYISGSMDIGEHPGGLIGENYIITNADSVRMYRNDKLIKEYKRRDSSYRNLRHGPIRIDDYLGDILIENEGISERQNELLKRCINEVAQKGYGFSKKMLLAAIQLKLFYRMTIDEGRALYTKYLANWGEKAGEYRFDAIRDGKVVKTVIKAPMKRKKLEYSLSHTCLKEIHSYDVAMVRLRMCDENGNVLVYFSEAARIEAAGAIELIGPDTISFKGGYAGFYVRSAAKEAQGLVKVSVAGIKKPLLLKFEVVLVSEEEEKPDIFDLSFGKETDQGISRKKRTGDL